MIDILVGHLRHSSCTLLTILDPTLTAPIHDHDSLAPSSLLGNFQECNTPYCPSFTFLTRLHGKLELRRFATTSADWGEAAPQFYQDPLRRQALGG
jgi:hypothetical protein